MRHPRPCSFVRPAIRTLERRLLLTETSLSVEDWGGYHNGTVEWTPAPLPPSDTPPLISGNQPLGERTTLAPNMGNAVPPFTHLWADWSTLPIAGSVGHNGLVEGGTIDRPRNHVLPGTYTARAELGSTTVFLQQYTLALTGQPDPYTDRFAVSGVIDHDPFNAYGYANGGTTHPEDQRVRVQVPYTAVDGVELSVTVNYPSSTPNDRWTLYYLAVTAFTPDVRVETNLAARSLLETRDAKEDYPLVNNKRDLPAFVVKRSGTPVDVGLTVNLAVKGGSITDGVDIVRVTDPPIAVDPGGGGGGQEMGMMGGPTGGGGVGGPGSNEPKTLPTSVYIPPGAHSVEIPFLPVDDPIIEAKEWLDYAVAEKVGPRYFAELDWLGTASTADDEPVRAKIDNADDEDLVVLISGRSQSGDDDENDTTATNYASERAGVRELIPLLTARGFKREEIVALASDGDTEGNPANYGDESREFILGIIRSRLLNIVAGTRPGQVPRTLDIGMHGYSWGGGMLFHVSERLFDIVNGNYAFQPRNFNIQVTSYVDGVRHGVWNLGSEETRRPTSTQFHYNYYQGMSDNVGAVPFEGTVGGGPVPQSVDNIDLDDTGSHSLWELGPPYGNNWFAHNQPYADTTGKHNIDKYAPVLRRIATAFAARLGKGLA